MLPENCVIKNMLPENCVIKTCFQRGFDKKFIYKIKKWSSQKRKINFENFEALTALFWNFGVRIVLLL